MSMHGGEHEQADAKTGTESDEPGSVDDAKEQTQTGKVERDLPEIGTPQVKEGVDPQRAPDRNDN